MARKPAASTNPTKPGVNSKKAKTAKVNQIEIIERQNKAVAMRRQGGSLRAIAKELGVSHEQVRLDIEAVMSEVIAESKGNVDVLRAMELEHIDELRLHTMHLLKKDRKNTLEWYDIERIQLTAVDRLRRLSERRSKLLGLDAPEKHDVKMVIPTFSDYLNGDAPDGD